MSSRPWLLSIFCALAFSTGAVPALADSVPAGTYFGLLEGDSYETSGYVRAVLSKSGHGSVAVQLGDEALCVVGFWLDPVQGTFVLKPGGDADMGVDLRIVWEPGGAPTIVGTVTDDGETVTVEARKTAAGSAFVGQPSGRFTFELGGISGYGSVTISRKGDVRGLLRLASGETIALGGALGADGTWPFFAMAKNGTTLSGAVTFDENGEFDGMLRRRAPATATTAAADSQVSIAGSPFDGTVGFGIADSHGAVAVGVGVYLQDEPDFGFPSLITRTGLFYQRENGFRVLALRFSPATGFITGRIKTPEGTVISLVGAVLQGPGWANGFLAGGKGFFGIEGGTRVTGGSTTTTTTGGTIILTGGVVKTGAGTLTLSVSNTYAGGTLTFSGGSLRIASDATLLSGGSATFVVLNPIVAIDPSVTFGGSLNLTGSNLVVGPPTIRNGGVIDLNAGTINVTSGTTTISGGTLTVNGNNTYTGLTNVNGGTLTLGNTATGGVTLNVTGGTSNQTGTNLTNFTGNLVLTNGGAGGLTFVNAPATMVFANSAATSFASGFHVTNEAGETIALPDVADGAIIFINGARYRASRPTLEGPITLVFAPL